ncbi:hypothetical protein [Cellulomonas gilvus]|uniref:Uncharacterized protein n=1 Tax=Cellulomonas gilvus (strain ATCC 13127 / NRRL B-14078) TaxID=593907 RepID=F8A6T1_CELGA|nr:hypothetical protein [Cellulomonas gilvus]AEI11141.1 hypothetical protein Celgi_0621 [Cellulomonas gilvus ATCC 13127]
MIAEAAPAPPSSPYAGLAPAPGTGSARSWWHVVRFVARHGLLRWVALGICLINAGVLTMRGAPWRGDLTWLIDFVPIGLLAVGPVVAGAAALDMARFGEGARHVEGMRFWRSPAAAVTYAYTIVAGGAYVLTIVVGAAVVPPVHVDRFAWLAVLAQVLMLALFTAVGTLLGRAVSAVLAGILAAVAVLALVFLTSSRVESGVALLYAGGSLVPRVGRGFDGGYLAVQALLLAAMVTACLVIRPGIARAGRIRAAEWAVVLTAGSLVVVAGQAGPDDRLARTNARPTDCAPVAGVTVCMFPEHRRVAGEVRRELGVVLEAARTHGYAALVPARVEEASASYSPGGPGTAAIRVEAELEGQAPSDEGLVLGLVEPTHCTPWDLPVAEAAVSGAELSEEYFADLDRLVGTWLALVDPDAVVAGAGDPGPPLLAPQEAARVMEQFRTCTYDFLAGPG